MVNIIGVKDGTKTGTAGLDVFFSTGNSTMYGGDGNDVFYLGGGYDIADGGAGDDQFYLNSPGQYGTLTGGAGKDTYIVDWDFSGNVEITDFNWLEDSLVLDFTDLGIPYYLPPPAPNTDADGNIVYNFYNGSSITLLGTAQPGPGRGEPMPEIPDHMRDTWHGTASNDEISEFKDSVHQGRTSADYQNFVGHGGTDVIRTDDKSPFIDNKIVVGYNEGKWTGESKGIEGVDYTAVYAGAGDDEIFVDALKGGSFDIRTGDNGADKVFVYGGNFVRIDDGGGKEVDEFHFGPDFSGKATIFSMDGVKSGSADKVVLHGDGWATKATLVDSNGDRKADYSYIKNDNGAVVTFEGVIDPYLEWSVL